MNMLNMPGVGLTKVNRMLPPCPSSFGHKQAWPEGSSLSMLKTKHTSELCDFFSIKWWAIIRFDCLLLAGLEAPVRYSTVKRIQL